MHRDGMETLRGDIELVRTLWRSQHSNCKRLSRRVHRFRCRTLNFFWAAFPIHASDNLSASRQGYLTVYFLEVWTSITINSYRFSVDLLETSRFQEHLQHVLVSLRHSSSQAKSCPSCQLPPDTRRSSRWACSSVTFNRDVPGIDPCEDTNVAIRSLKIAVSAERTRALSHCSD